MADTAATCWTPPNPIERRRSHLVEDGQRTVTLQVSSGSGETYTNAGGPATARTPVGNFAIQRRIHGVREAALGTLYDPCTSTEASRSTVRRPFPPTPRVTGVYGSPVRMRPG